MSDTVVETPELTPANDTFFDDLASMDEKFGEIKVTDKKAVPPDDDYTVEVVTVVFDKPKDKPRLNLHLRITKGDYRKKMLFKSIYISKDNLNIVKDELFRMDLKLDKISDLLARNQELKGKWFEVAKRTRPDNDGKFYNIYVNKVVDAVESEEEATDGTPF